MKNLFNHEQNILSLPAYEYFYELGPLVTRKYCRQKNYRLTKGQTNQTMDQLTDLHSNSYTCLPQAKFLGYKYKQSLE